MGILTLPLAGCILLWSQLLREQAIRRMGI